MKTDLGAALEPQRSHTRPRLPRWVTAAVVGAAALTLAGAVIAQFAPAVLVGSTAVINDAAARYAQYTATRGYALAGLLLATLILRRRRTLATLMILTAVIQLFDAIGDLLEQRWMLTPGLLLLAAVFGAAARRLTGQPGSRDSNAPEPSRGESVRNER